MRKVLHLIDHYIVDFRSFVASIPDDIKDVVDSIHDVVASTSNLPPLVLAERLIDIQFLCVCEEGIGSGANVGMLREVLAGVLVRLC
jgi:hypothetical protein